MIKDFDRWNELKKEIDCHFKNKYVKEGEIWWCAIGINIGYESNGKNKYFERPVLIIKKYTNNFSLICPITTSHKRHPYKIKLGLINGRDNYLNTSQIKSIDNRRLLNLVRKISNEKLKKITKTALKS